MIFKKEAKNNKKHKLTGTIADYPLVEVKWYDAVGDSGWMDINKAILSKPAHPVNHTTPNNTHRNTQQRTTNTPKTPPATHGTRQEHHRPSHP